MIGFLIRRLLQAAVVVLLVTMITFILLRAIPGNVAVAVLGPSSYRNPQVLAAFNREYGFDRPWFDQYLLWLGHVLTGDFVTASWDAAAWWLDRVRGDDSTWARPSSDSPMRVQASKSAGVHHCDTGR